MDQMIETVGIKIDNLLHSTDLILYSCLCGVLYVVVVLIFTKGQSDAKTTPPSWIKTVVVPVHNFILVAWSLYMHIGLWRSMLTRADPWSIACPTKTVRSEFEDAVLWSLLLSKYYELFDTAVHMALGHKISFLHAFHHSIVLGTTSTWYVADLPLVLVGAAFNTGVHVVMYSYYFLTALGYKPFWKSAVTSLQVVQFVVSMVGFVTAVVLNNKPSEGCQNMPLFYVASAFNVVLLVLFSQLLLSNSSKKSKKPKAK